MGFLVYMCNGNRKHGMKKKNIMFVNIKNPIKILIHRFKNTGGKTMVFNE